MDKKPFRASTNVRGGVEGGGIVPCPLQASIYFKFVEKISKKARSPPLQQFWPYLW